MSTTQFCVPLIEYDNLSRLGITDTQSYLKRRFKGKSIVYLKTCCAGPLVVDNLEAAIDEALSSGTWLDVMVNIVVCICRFYVFCQLENKSEFIDPSSGI